MVAMVRCRHTGWGHVYRAAHHQPSRVPGAGKWQAAVQQYDQVSERCRVDASLTRARAGLRDPLQISRRRAPQRRLRHVRKGHASGSFAHDRYMPIAVAQ